MVSGLRREAVGQLQPALRVAAALLDAAETSGDVVRERDGVLADLETADRRLGGARAHGARKDNAGVQDSEGIEGALHPPEELHDLVSVDAGEEPRAKPSVAMLAGRRPAEPDERAGDRVEQRGHGLLPARPP